MLTVCIYTYLYEVTVNSKIRAHSSKFIYILLCFVAPDIQEANRTNSPELSYTLWTGMYEGCETKNQASSLLQNAFGFFPTDINHTGLPASSGTYQCSQLTATALFSPISSEMSIQQSSCSNLAQHHHQTQPRSAASTPSQRTDEAILV